MSKKRTLAADPKFNPLRHGRRAFTLGRCQKRNRISHKKGQTFSSVLFFFPRLRIFPPALSALLPLLSPFLPSSFIPFSLLPSPFSLLFSFLFSLFSFFLLFLCFNSVFDNFVRVSNFVEILSPLFCRREAFRQSPPRKAEGFPRTRLQSAAGPFSPSQSSPAIRFAVQRREFAQQTPFSPYRFSAFSPRHFFALFCKPIAAPRLSSAPHAQIRASGRSSAAQPTAAK